MDPDLITHDKSTDTVVCKLLAILAECMFEKELRSGAHGGVSKNAPSESNRTPAILYSEHTSPSLNLEQQ